MTRHKKELMECARMLAGQSDRTSEELLHQAQEKQLTHPSFHLPAQGGGPDQGELEIFVPFESGRASCKA